VWPLTKPKVELEITDGECAGCFVFEITSASIVSRRHQAVQQLLVASRPGRLGGQDETNRGEVHFPVSVGPWTGRKRLDRRGAANEAAAIYRHGFVTFRISGEDPLQ
jgi:hypothetical protein